MLKYRLMLGPVMMASIVLLSWLDGAIEGMSILAWARPLFFGRETLPPGVAIFVWAVVLSIWSSRELATILKVNGIAASKRVTTTAAILGLLVSCVVPQGASAVQAVAAVGTAAVAVLLLALVFHARHKSFEGAVAAAGGALLAFVYLGLMFGFVLAIRREHSVWLLLWIVVVTKACDIGAYFTGRAIGKHKLILWLSPGKTWEGLYGGIVLACVVGYFGLMLLSEAGVPGCPEAWTGIAAGVIFAVTGQLGDLVASLFKRDAGLKDSSKALPGFGGLLDVMDSPLLVMPVAYWWMTMVSR
ncbi:MAG: phosphatidate cytidylyltransferase [Phycisphaerales bacterium]